MLREGREERKYIRVGEDGLSGLGGEEERMDGSRKDDGKIVGGGGRGFRGERKTQGLYVGG